MSAGRHGANKENVLTDKARPIVDVPDAFRRHMLEFHGDKGADWLQRLPSIVAECEQRWSIAVQPPVPNLSFNYVAPAVRADGVEVMLKVGVITRELTTEVEALRLYNGDGSVELLDADHNLGALLLERLKPGVALFDLVDDEQATMIAANVMKQLWRPVPANHPFPSIAEWADGLHELRVHFGGATGPFPKRLVEQAESLFHELLVTQAEPVVLHGDLHHWNILTAERQPWLAIDPKGVVGEPTYEVGALLRNPTPHIMNWPQLDRILARRIDILADELGFDRERIIGWALAQAVLSSWWSFEDNGRGWQPALHVAERLAAL